MAMDLPILIISGIILCAAVAAIIMWRRHVQKNWRIRRALLDGLATLESAIATDNEPSMICQIMELGYRIYELDELITDADRESYALLKSKAQPLIDDHETRRLWEHYRDAQTDRDKRSALVALTNNHNAQSWMERTGKETTLEQLRDQLRDLTVAWLSELYGVTADTFDAYYQDFLQLKSVLQEMEGAITFWNHRMVRTVAFPEIKHFADMQGYPSKELLQVAATAIDGDDFVTAKWLFALHTENVGSELDPIAGQLALYIAKFNRLHAHE